MPENSKEKDSSDFCVASSRPFFDFAEVSSYMSDVGDASLHYQVYTPTHSSEDIPLLFIHGNAENLHYFSPQYACFAKKFTCIGVDCRGRGLSTTGTKKLTLSLIGDDIISLLSYIGVSKAHIIGFSDGANIALDICFKKPDLVSSLVLNGGNLFPKGMDSKTYTQTILKYGIYSFMSLFLKKYRHKKSLYRLMAQEPSFTFESLNNIKCPALVIVGENDVIRPEHSEKIAISLPNGRLKVIPDGTHFISSEMPDVYNRELCSFLKKKEV